MTKVTEHDTMLLNHLDIPCSADALLTAAFHREVAVKAEQNRIVAIIRDAAKFQIERGGHREGAALDILATSIEQESQP